MKSAFLDFHNLRRPDPYPTSIFPSVFASYPQVICHFSYGGLACKSVSGSHVGLGRYWTTIEFARRRPTDFRPRYDCLSVLLNRQCVICSVPHHTFREEPILGGEWSQRPLVRCRRGKIQYINGWTEALYGPCHTSHCLPLSDHLDLVQEITCDHVMPDGTGVARQSMDGHWVY